MGSKITKETITVVKDFGVQLGSYNIKGNLVSERFIDMSRIRDFVINEVCLRRSVLLAVSVLHYVTQLF